jgi:hypothetical protein
MDPRIGKSSISFNNKIDNLYQVSNRLRNPNPIRKERENQTENKKSMERFSSTKEH